MSELQIEQDGPHVTLRPSPMEKTIAGIVVALIVVLLSWVGFSTVGTAQAVAVLSEKIDGMETRRIEASTAEARRVDDKINALDARVTRLEGGRHIGG